MRYLQTMQYSQTLKSAGGGRILQFVTMLPKARPLCTPVPNQILETILGEVDKDSFIMLPGKAFQGSLDIKSTGHFIELQREEIQLHPPEHLLKLP